MCCASGAYECECCVEYVCDAGIPPLSFAWASVMFKLSHACTMHFECRESFSAAPQRCGLRDCSRSHDGLGREYMPAGCTVDYPLPPPSEADGCGYGSDDGCSPPPIDINVDDSDCGGGIDNCMFSFDEPDPIDAGVVVNSLYKGSSIALEVASAQIVHELELDHFYPFAVNGANDEIRVPSPCSSVSDAPPPPQEVSFCVCPGSSLFYYAITCIRVLGPALTFTITNECIAPNVDMGPGPTRSKNMLLPPVCCTLDRNRLAKVLIATPSSPIVDCSFGCYCASVFPLSFSPILEGEAYCFLLGLVNCVEDDRMTVFRQHRSYAPNSILLDCGPTIHRARNECLCGNSLYGGHYCLQTLRLCDKVLNASPILLYCCSDVRRVSQYSCVKQACERGSYSMLKFSRSNDCNCMTTTCVDLERKFKPAIACMGSNPASYFSCPSSLLGISGPPVLIGVCSFMHDSLVGGSGVVLPSCAGGAVGGVTGMCYCCSGSWGDRSCCCRRLVSVSPCAPGAGCWLAPDYFVIDCVVDFRVYCCDFPQVGSSGCYGCLHNDFCDCGEYAECGSNYGYPSCPCDEWCTFSSCGYAGCHVCHGGDVDICSVVFGRSCGLDIKRLCGFVFHHCFCHTSCPVNLASKGSLKKMNLRFALMM